MIGLSLQILLDLYMWVGWTGINKTPNIFNKILDWILLVLRAVILGLLIFSYKK